MKKEDREDVEFNQPCPSQSVRRVPSSSSKWSPTFVACVQGARCIERREARNHDFNIHRKVYIYVYIYIYYIYMYDNDYALYYAAIYFMQHLISYIYIYPGEYI